MVAARYLEALAMINRGAGHSQAPQTFCRLLAERRFSQLCNPAACERARTILVPLDDVDGWLYRVK